MTTPVLILASSSPYRRALLERLRIPFEVAEPDIDESPRQSEDARALVRRLAVTKAQVVAQARTGVLVIGSDQVAVRDGITIGKPASHEDAVRQLHNASGKTVVLYTGLALLNSDSGRIQSDVIPIRVVFRDLSEQQIENYLRKEQPYKCTGSVKAEGLGVALLERVECNDPNALIGLPLIRLVQMLEMEGVSVL